MTLIKGVSSFDSNPRFSHSRQSCFFFNFAQEKKSSGRPGFFSFLNSLSLPTDNVSMERERRNNSTYVCWKGCYYIYYNRASLKYLGNRWSEMTLKKRRKKQHFSVPLPFLSPPPLNSSSSISSSSSSCPISFFYTHEIPFLLLLQNFLFREEGEEKKNTVIFFFFFAPRTS